MNKIICIGEYGKQNVFYNQDRDEFYIADYFYFDDFNQNDEDLEIINYSAEQEKKLASVKVTDEELLREIKEFYEVYKRDVELHEQNLEKLRTRIKKKGSYYEKKNHNLKRIKKGVTIVGLLAILGVITKDIRAELTNKILNDINTKHLENQNDEEHMRQLSESLNSNTTISDELRSYFMADINLIVDKDIYLSEHKLNNICTRLSTTDFKDYNINNYQSVLAQTLFNNDNIVSLCVAHQIDEAANNREPSKESLLFGTLTCGVDGYLINDLFFYGDVKFIDDLAKYYNASFSDTKKLLDILSQYNEAISFEDKTRYEEEFKKEFASILTECYRNKWGKNTTFDNYILASQIFNGEFNIQNNLFEDMTTVTYNDPNYGEYNLYFDSEGTDISRQIYYDKLVDLIRAKGNNLDYQDKDCRFLVYMVTLCYEDGISYDYQYLTSSQTPEELAEKILNTVFTPEGFTDQRIQVLYSYLTSGTMDVYEMAREVGIPSYDAFSIALFQEFYKCLLIDYANGDFPEEDFAWHNEYLYEFIKRYNGNNKEKYEAYNILLDVLGTDTSLFSEFKLYPFTYSYAREDIIKYIYTKETDK